MHSLQDVSVELQLAVPQKLSDHLSAQAFPLQQEVGHPDGRVWDEATRDQEVDASLWIPVTKNKLRVSSVGVIFMHSGTCVLVCV